MSSLVLLLFLYGIGMTAGMIAANSSKDKYKRMYTDLQRRYEALARSVQQPQPEKQVQPEAQVQAPAAAAPADQAPVNKAPQYVYQPNTPAPLPVYTPAPKPAAKKDHKQGLGAVGVSFAVGVLLMVIAAAVFISATWQTMPAGVKCVVLALVVALVYGFSALCKGKLKLEKTSSVLYMLGSLITPLAIFVGFLAFESEETVIMLCCCALSLGVTGFIGYKIFGSKLQVAISYIGFVWMEIFICMQALGNYEGFVVGICVAAFVSGLIHYVKPDLKFFGLFAEITAYVAVTGFFMTAGIDHGMMPCAVISQVLYWAALFMLNRRRSWVKYVSAIVPVYSLLIFWLRGYVGGRTGFSVIVLIVIVLSFALYKFLKQENLSSNALISAGIGLVFFLILALSEDDTRDFMYYAALISPVASFAYVLITTKIKWERSVYWYLEFFAVLVMTEIILKDTIAPFYIFLGIAAAAVLSVYKFRQIHIVFAAVGTTVISFFIHAEKIVDNDLRVIIFMTASLALYTAVVFINRKLKLGAKQWNITRMPLLALLLISSFVLLSAADCVNVPFIALIVLDIIFFAVTLFDIDNYFGIIPSGTFMLAVVSELLDRGMDELAVGTIFVLVFVILGRLLVCEKIIRKGRIDWLTILAGLACFIPASRLYMSTFLMSFFIMSFVGRFSDADSLEEKLRSNIRVILSAAVGMLAISFAIVDVEIAGEVDYEARLFILLAAAALVNFVIKPGEASRWIWFSTVAFCIELEAGRAVFNGKLLPLTLVSVCVCGIFIYSFIAKKRSWFILAIGNIGLIGIIFAITFWESKLWWVYLLVLGGILIGTASFNEYKRRVAAESGQEDKKIRIFDSWTW